MAQRLGFDPGTFVDDSSAVPLNAAFANGVKSALNTDNFDADLLAGKAPSSALSPNSIPVTSAEGYIAKAQLKSSDITDKVAEGGIYNNVTVAGAGAANDVGAAAGATTAIKLGNATVAATESQPGVVQLAATTPAALGTAAKGSSSTAAKSDHVHDMPDLDQVLAVTQVESKGYMPIGATYVQYPGTDLPGDIFTGTWSNISSMYAGAFFRAEGGAALAFGGGQQSAQNLAHVHSNSVGNQSADHTHSGTTGTESANHTHGVSFSSGGQSANHKHIQYQGSSNGGGYATADYNFGLGTALGYTAGQGGPLNSYLIGTANASSDHSHYISGNTNGMSVSHSHGFSTSGISASHNHAVTINSEGGADLRPINYTVRIWKRTA